MLLERLMLPLLGGRLYWLMLVGLTGTNKDVDADVSNNSRRIRCELKKEQRLTEVGVVVFSCVGAGGSRRRQWGLATCVLKAPC